MAIRLFPREEYWLNSPLTAAEAFDAINANVMERDVITFGLLGSIIDKKMRTYRYFEGSVWDMQFKINSKQYWNNSSTTRPIINGTIEQARKASLIHIVCSPSDWRIYLPLIIPLFAIISFTLESPTSRSPAMLTLYLVVYLIIVTISRYRYIRRLKKDKEQLITIFDASEAPSQE